MTNKPGVADFLALRRNTMLLLAALVLAGTGERLWLGFAPKYLETLGAGVLVIGLFDALQTFLGAVYAYPGGWLTARWGQRRSLLLFNALTLAGYVLVLVWHHWLALVAGAFLFLSWSALSLPATFSVVASSLDKSQHTMGIGVQSLVRRVPMMVRMGKVRQHDIFERIWIVRITSEKNLRKQAKEATKVVRDGFKYSGVAIEKGSLTLSLEGRRGLAVFILSAKA